MTDEQYREVILHLKYIGDIILGCVLVICLIGNFMYCYSTNVLFSSFMLSNLCIFILIVLVRYAAGLFRETRKERSIIGNPS
jgi:hypothetical protein